MKPDFNLVGILDCELSFSIQRDNRRFMVHHHFIAGFKQFPFLDSDFLDNAGQHGCFYLEVAIAQPEVHSLSVIRTDGVYITPDGCHA